MYKVYDYFYEELEKMNDKVKLTFEDLKSLATLAKRNGTEHLYQQILLEWCAAATTEIERLYAENTLKDSTQAAKDVLEERQRQVEVKGFGLERDQSYINYELRDVALCYASENTDFWPYDFGIIVGGNLKTTVLIW